MEIKKMTINVILLKRIQNIKTPAKTSPDKVRL